MSFLPYELLARHADDDAVAFGPQGAVTAAELRARARGVREALAKKHGEQVVLACADRLHFCAGLLGAWSLGLQVWLPHNVQPEAIEALSRRPGVRALLHDRDADTGVDVRALPRSTGPLSLALPADRVVAVVHTSGSTGEPAAHPKTWGQLGGETRQLLEHFPLGGRCIVATVPAHHIYGLLFGVLVPLCGGGRVARDSPLLPGDVASAMNEAAAEVLISVPAQLRSLDAAALPAGCVVFSSGAPLSPATGQALRAAGARVVEVLGSTETGGIASRAADGAAWRCFPRVRMQVDEEGRLAVDSPWLSPQASRPYRCADRVELEGEGFRHLGRADRVVKLGGRRVDLGAVETALSQLPGVQACRVVAVPSAGLRGVELLAAIEGDVEADALQPAQLRAALCRVLDPVTVPRRYRVVRELPQTAAGKLSDADVLSLFERPVAPPPPLDDRRVRESERATGRTRSAIVATADGTARAVGAVRAAGAAGGFAVTEENAWLAYDEERRS